MAEIRMTPELRQRVLDITNQAGFQMETGATWNGEPYIKLIAPPAGRGKERKRFLIMAPTLSDAFHALAEITA